MPRSTIQSPRQQLFMQLAMWLVLAGTVALAAGVDRVRSLVDTPPLSTDSYTDGVISIRLPTGWSFEQPRNSHDGRIVLTVVEPAGARHSRGRTLRLIRQGVDPSTNPTDFLTQSNYLDQLYSSDDREGSTRGRVPPTLGTNAQVQAMRIDGYSEHSPTGARLREKMALFAIFPNDQAVTLTVSRLGELDASDVRLLDLVADTISFANIETDTR